LLQNNKTSKLAGGVGKLIFDISMSASFSLDLLPLD